jgi:hypothetical protein
VIVGNAGRLSDGMGIGGMLSESVGSDASSDGMLMLIVGNAGRLSDGIGNGGIDSDNAGSAASKLGIAILIVGKAGRLSDGIGIGGTVMVGKLQLTCPAPTWSG